MHAVILMTGCLVHFPSCARLVGHRMHPPFQPFSLSASAKSFAERVSLMFYLFILVVEGVYRKTRPSLSRAALIPPDFGTEIDLSGRLA